MKLFRKLLILMAFAMPLLIATPDLASAQSYGEKIILVDFARVTNESFLGQDVQTQLQDYSDAIAARKIALESVLTAEREDLTSRENLMDADIFQELATAWETKYANAQSEIEVMRQNLAKASQTADQEITRHLRPIVLNLMNEKGADLVINKGYIYISRAGFDITGEVIAALNAVSTAFPLTRLQN